MPMPVEVTQLLTEVKENRPGARDRLLEVVYDELRQIARGQVANERPGHTLQATALVNEAYVRVLATGRLTLENRRHLFGAFAEAMRQILVESARRRNARKRGGGRERVPLEAVEVAAEDPSVDVLTLDRVLPEFEREDPRAGEVVRLRVYAGLTEDVIAELLGVSTKTVQRDWNYAKAWLQRAVSDADPAAGDE
jgi:RNA polymerase sigma factor (TIGR02999 family)